MNEPKMKRKQFYDYLVEDGLLFPDGSRLLSGDLERDKDSCRFTWGRFGPWIKKQMGIKSNETT